jgi:hypothetical protein
MHWSWRYRRIHLRFSRYTKNDRSSVPKTSANIQKVKQLPASSSITPVLALCSKPPRSSTLSPSFPCEEQKGAKTYNSGDSLVVTHLTTNPPVHCLYMAERTGSLIFSVLWSYVTGKPDKLIIHR